MFDWFFYIVAAVLAAPMVAVIALVRSVQLNKRLHGIELKLAMLERQSAPAVSSPPQAVARPPAAPPEAASATVPEAPISPVPPPSSLPRASSSGSVPNFPQASASPAAHTINFEERFGTRWVVWIGGVALALGGVFLVRYSIQQGLIGPGVRILLGSLLALALIFAGEWQRRNEEQLSLPGVPTANIPSVLTAAGTTVGYTTVYAAYALYEFLPPAAAFLLLGAVALATLAAALLHGPALAGLGIVGAYLAPMLVTSKEPDYWSLYVYIAVVTAAAFALARFRLWYGLALTALIFGALWSLPGLDLFLLTVTAALGAHVFHVLAGFALAATFLVANLLYGPRTAPSQMDRLSNLALSIYLVVATLLVLASRHDPAALIAFVVLTAATVGIAWRTEAATPSVVVATVLAAVVMAHWAVHERLDALIARTTRPLPYRIVAALTSVILALFYFTLEVRRLFHGPALAGITSDAEQYTYSTVWLMFGIALLAVGVVLRSQPARFLALGVIALTIAKVFLFDTANIAGIYRALSVTGLGVVLLGIGWLYQRVLYPEAAAPADGARLL